MRYLDHMPFQFNTAVGLSQLDATVTPSRLRDPQELVSKNKEIELS